MRRCFTDPHYWKNPALRRSREKHIARIFDLLAMLELQPSCTCLSHYLFGCNIQSLLTTQNGLSLHVNVLDVAQLRLHNKRLRATAERPMNNQRACQTEMKPPTTPPKREDAPGSRLDSHGGDRAEAQRIKTSIFVRDFPNFDTFDTLSNRLECHKSATPATQVKREVLQLPP